MIEMISESIWPSNELSLKRWLVKWGIQVCKVKNKNLKPLTDQKATQCNGSFEETWIRFVWTIPHISEG